MLKRPIFNFPPVPLTTKIILNLRKTTTRGHVAIGHFEQKIFFRTNIANVLNFDISALWDGFCVHISDYFTKMLSLVDVEEDVF